MTLRGPHLKEGFAAGAGVHEMSMHDYQKDPAPQPSLSSGIAHTMLAQSALHAWFAHPRLNPHHQPEEDDKFDLGSTAHALLLEGEASIAVIEAPDWRKKEAKDARESARQAHKIPVLAHKMAECRLMAEIARKALAGCKDRKIELAAGQAERVLIWQDGNAWCRARPDWMDEKIMLNYKSTAGSAEPNAWSRNQMGPLGFDLEAAHYLRGAKILKLPLTEYVFLVQENYPPYACSFVSPDPAMMDIAERKRDFALQLWAHAMNTGEWDGYPQRIAYAMPSAWQVAEAEEFSFERRIALGAQG